MADRALNGCPPRFGIGIGCGIVLATLLLGVPASAAPPDLRVPAGFEIRLAAGEGLVERPICADLDEHGRLFVAESSGSNAKVEEQLAERPHRILRLEDVDGDGVYDRRVVFADGMMMPQGILYHDGAVYCGAPPSIWKLQDTDGDGVADVRDEWWNGGTLTGCANDVHGPYLGPDGYLYWCKGGFAKQTHRLPGGRMLEDAAAHIYRSRPDGSDFDSFLSGGMDNPVEIAWDAAGNLFFTTTFFNHPRGGKRDAIVHGVYGGVYPKVHGVIDGLVRTGELLPAMTHLGPAAPCGLHRYRGNTFGPEFAGNLFCCQFNTHKVSRHILQESGSTFTTLDSDFVVSDNPDFHPTDVLEDRDGSLLVIDTGAWYKLCCPTSQLAKPEVPGAIYRVRRTDPIAPLEPVRSVDPPPGIPDDPIARLRHPSAHVRRSAASEIALRPNRAAVPVLLEAAGNPVDQLLEHAIIYALIAIRNPQATALGLESDRPHTRRAAMLALDQMGGAGISAEALRAALDNPEALVRETAWWIYSAHPERGGELVEYFERHPEELDRLGSLGNHPALAPLRLRWIRAALASREESRVVAALPVLRGFDPGELKLFQDDLAALSRDETLAAGVRLGAIELLADPVPNDLFLFLNGQEDGRAAAQLARAELDARQLGSVTASLAEANPLQLPHLMQCFRNASDGNLGESILTQLQKAPSLTSLREADIDRALGHFPTAVRERARALVAARRSELADPARLEKIASELPDGDPARGHLVFNSSKAACFSCHAIGYRGGDFGPGLSRIGSVRSERDLLEAIVFPSASSVRSYEPVLVTQDGGQVLVGIVADRNEHALTLRIAPGAPAMVIPHTSISEIRPAEASLMPSGLAEQLTRQELSDLIAFLRSMR